MPLSGDEPMCPKFQPNIFDPSRCHDCLRQKHLHSGAVESTEPEATAKPQSLETNSGTRSGIGTGNGIGLGLLPHKGGPLQAVPSKAEEKDTSSKDDSDGVSVVSSYCDVSGGRAGYGESSLCILSPDCELYFCDEDDDRDIDEDDDSTDSGRAQSYYPELCGSVSADDDYLPVRRQSTHLTMTRLDPLPNRPNPRVWMEEARSKDRFGRHSGSNDERQNRESGYFSVGKAAGARSIRDQSPVTALAGARSNRDQSPVTAFRHYERGHTLYNTRSIEPKDIIPFRNPNLGVASERQPPELLNEDLPEEILPPDPYEVAIEVEAQVGPRSPSPTPFKIAESLASAGGRRGRGNSSYGRGNLSSNTSSHQQTGRFDSSRQGSALQSRSSSPSQGNVPFRRSESTASLNRRNFDCGGRSQGCDQRSGSLSQSKYGRSAESGTLPRNFKSQSSIVSDFSSSLHKTEVNGSLTGRGGHRRSSSPPKRDYNSTGQTSLRKTETSSSLSNGRGRDMTSSSPPRRDYNSTGQTSLRKAESSSSLLNGRGREMTSSSPPRRDYNSTGQTSLRKAESSSSLLNGRGREMTSSSPPRRDYNSTGQTSLRKAESSSSLLNGRGRDSRTSSPSRRTYDPQTSTSPRRNYNSPSQSVLRKSESAISLNGRSHHGRCGSPIREGYDIESQAKMRNPEPRNAMNDQEHEIPGSSPARRDYNVTSQNALRKTQSSSYGGSRGCDSRSSSPGRRSSEGPGQYLLKKTDTGGSLNARGRESRNPSPSRKSYDGSQSLLRKSETNSSGRSYGRSQDSRSSSPSRRGYETPGHSSLRKTETSSSLSGRAFNSQSSSPSRRGNNDPPGYSILRAAASGESMCSSQRKSTYSDKRSDSSHAPRTSPSSPPPPRMRESNHSIHNSSSSRAASPSRQATENSRTAFSQRTSTATMQASRSSSVNRAGGGRRSPETRSSSPSDKRPSLRIRSPSPSPQNQMRRHTSSQSSMESSESGQLSVGSSGRNKEEYAMLADLPKVKIIHQREESGYVGQTQNNGPAPKQKLFKPASHSVSKQPSKWEDPGDLDRDHAGWHHGGSGRLSRAQSSTSLHMQRSSSPIEENSSWTDHHQGSEEMQPDLLNFKKGWMSKLDESGEWKKHWFVLSDAGLKYYRDSGAEEKDDLDGEIDLKSCMKVSEFDVEKNYGFQIQTREAVFTLSAMTAGIRRNWIEVLRKSVRPISSPDLTQLPDSSSDKENSHTRSLSVSRRPPARHGDSRSAPPTSAPSTPRRFDYVELSPVPVPSHPLPTSQREAGEGQGREHSQWQEERNKDAMTSQWEAVLSRKAGSGSDPRLQTEEDIERKWAEFERMPLTEMRSLPSVGSRSSSQPAIEALQREVASLRQQVERLQGGGGGGRAGGGGGGGGGVAGGCGPEAPCGRSLASMERAHRQALEELQRQHQRQTRELETEKDRLLLEETQATAQVMQALRKAHKEELEREVEKAKRLSGGVVDSQTLHSHQQETRAETQALQRELASLSERYSQKCLELNRAEQNNAEREREICRKERDIEQLRKENQDLQTRLKEEIRRMRAVISGQGSEGVSNDNRDRTSSELEVLLRVKENEVEYLHKEISCLRNELQFLNTEKRLACDRYKEMHEELSGMKGRSEREIQNLKENLRLAMAALQEGQVLGNSLDH